MRGNWRARASHQDICNNLSQIRDFFVTKMRNIEIKATLTDPDAVKTRAKELSGSDGTIIKQKDTFYRVSQGRLKLREFTVSIMLIFNNYYSIKHQFLGLIASIVNLKLNENCYYY